MSVSMTTQGTKSLLFVGFNQDCSCFAAGTDTGFVIFTCSPNKNKLKQMSLSSRGGIGIIEMLYRSNIHALVGGGKQPCYPPHKVMLWDDVENRTRGELTFRSAVKAVKLRRDMVVVVLENSVFVYDLQTLQSQLRISTVDNYRGLCALCADESSNTLLACPGLRPGHVQILKNLGENIVIPAHKTELTCIALSNNGEQIATASAKGTLIRVFSTSKKTDCQPLHELRLGFMSTDVLCIALHPSNPYLACSSSQGMIHIFSLGEEQHAEKSFKSEVTSSGVDNKSISAYAGDVAEGIEEEKTPVAGGYGQTPLSFATAVLPGFLTRPLQKLCCSEWSFAQFQTHQETPTICAFGEKPGTLNAIGADGSFYALQFSKSKGCEQKFFRYFTAQPNSAGTGAD